MGTGLELVSVTLTGNAAHLIEGSLASVAGWVDACLVVDTGVTDSTLDVARAAAPGKFLCERFAWIDDFAAARNFAMAAASESGARWAMIVDTDERLDLRGVDIHPLLNQTSADVLTVRHESGVYAKEPSASFLLMASKRSPSMFGPSLRFSSGGLRLYANGPPASPQIRCMLWFAGRTNGVQKDGRYIGVMSNQRDRMNLIQQRVRRRRVLAGAGAGAAGLALLACSSRGRSSPSSASPQGTAQTAQSGGTYTTYIQYNAILDPHKAQAGAQTVIGGVYSRIFRFTTGTDPKVFTDHNIEPDLGVSAESPDAITWTVKLRPDPKFHNVPPVNGHAVEAEDVKATFVRALDPATNNQNRGSLSMIDSAQIQTPDKQTVVFKLNYPYAPFRKLLAAPAYSWIFPREVLTGGYDPSKTAIGSGPFTLESFTPDVAYIYKKNPSWFEKDRPYVDGIKLPITADPSQQLAQFTAGNLDELSIVNPFDVEAAQQRNPKANVVKSLDGRPFPLYLQLGDPTGPMMDVRVRRALSMAIDRDAIAKVIYNSQGFNTFFVPAYMGRWATVIDQLDPSIQQWFKFNPSESKKLLEAAGQSSLTLRLAYISGAAYTTPTYTKTAETLANMLSVVGVKTSVITHDNNKDYVDAGKGSRQGYFDKDVMIFSGIPSDTDADQMLFSNFHSKSNTNAEHLNDTKLDAMIDKERTLVNEDERWKAVQDIGKYMADQVFVIPTPGSYTWVLVQPRVQDFSYTNDLAKFTENYSKVWIKA